MAPTNITPTKTRQVFFSKDANHRIVRVPQAEEPRGPAGIVREINPALVCQFEDGYYVVDDQERKRHDKFFELYPDVEESTSSAARSEPGDRCSPEEFLRKHHAKDIEYRGFVEIEPVAPDPASEMQKITEAVLEGDIDGLIAIYEAEEQGWRREPVLESAKQSIATLEERQEAAAAS